MNMVFCGQPRAWRRFSPGSVAGVEGAWFFTPYMGVGSRLTVSGTFFLDRTLQVRAPVHFSSPQHLGRRCRRCDFLRNDWKMPSYGESGGMQSMTAIAGASWYMRLRTFDEADRLGGDIFRRAVPMSRREFQLREDVAEHSIASRRCGTGMPGDSVLR